MKIVKCPKGGRVPEGYCMQSCLNYSGKIKREDKSPPRNPFPDSDKGSSKE